MLNYRNMPHPSTGKTLAKLMMRQQIRTRLPQITRLTNIRMDKEAKAQDKETRQNRKEEYDK